ncbi:transmembrane protein 117-like [Mytilus californianus]|uniref:transmembrane protein 117-like n=1 Tax=Mytilus californianus TaxID=6549 RepID=UPI0022455E3F|nr:transmembrane protein 117-like [Mytilus californianus]
MASKPVSIPAVVEVQHHDDDKHSVSSQDQLLVVDLDDNLKNQQNSVMAENNNDSKEKYGKDDIVKDESKEEKFAAKEDMLIEKKEGNDDENKEFQRNGSSKSPKKKKRKKSVKDNEVTTVTADINNSSPKVNKGNNKEQKNENTEKTKEDVTVNLHTEANEIDENASNNISKDTKKDSEKPSINEKDSEKPSINEKDSEKLSTNGNDSEKPSTNGTDLNKSTNKIDEITIEAGPDELDGFTKVTADDQLDHDALSQFSYKEAKDFKYYFQHPYLRLFIAYFVTFCNFLIYAEDPVAHSKKECNIPLVGNDFAFVCTRYPSNAWSLLKVVLWFSAIIVGMIIGKLVVHKLFFCKLLRLKMFCDDQGSWMIMFLFSLISVFIFSWLYNAFLLAGGSSTEDYRISGLLGLSNSIFMKAAATGTWCGDFFTAWMVTDMMLQEKLYPYWGRPIRKWWNRKYNRIILFWIVTSVTSFTVLFTIATDYIQWDKLHRDFLSSNEVSRAFLASFILVMDILIVVQDWDFPHFISAIDIKLPGVNTAHITFDIPKCFRPDKWQIHITGKWFNYGILFLVMILDLNMWKNQIFYYPYDYGQYTDNDGKIHTVNDDFSLENHNETLMSFSYRNSTINPLTNQTYISEDGVMNSRFYDNSLAVKAIAFIPALAAFITFGVLIWQFGRFKPSKTDPYAGRLLKRPKKKSSFRLFKESFGKRFSLRNRVKAVPKLLAFTRRRNTNTGKADFPVNDRPSTDPVS